MKSLFKLLAAIFGAIIARRLCDGTLMEGAIMAMVLLSYFDSPNYKDK
jgi:hypothetical protein